MNDNGSPLRLSPAIGALALTLLAFGLRLHRLDFQPLWGDEGWSFYFASMSLGEMIRLTAQDIHPPLYYALLGGWLRLVGSIPELARYLSILCGTALVPLSYRVACRLFDRVAALVTALIAGPDAAGLQPPLPKSVTVESVYLMDGEVVLDLASPEDRPPPSGSEREMLTVFSLVNTVLLNTEGAERLVLLWNGQQPMTFAGHLNTARPLKANRDLVARDPVAREPS